MASATAVARRPGRKIVQITTVHRAFDSRIFHKECRTLALAGYEVVLVAPHDRQESVNGVRIVGLPRPRGRLTRATVSAWRAYRAALAEDSSICHFHDPELLPVGLLLKLRGRRVVYDVHEDLPRQILTKDWIPRWCRQPLAWLVERLERVGSRPFDGIVAATPTIANRFPANRTLVVHNYPLLEELTAIPAVPYAERPAHAIYVGGMHAIRGLHNMVNAIGLLPPSFGARLRLAGEISAADKATLQGTPGWARVDDLGWQARELVIRELTRARAGLVVLHPRANYLESMPIKLFEYMAAGVPVVASDFPLWRQIVSSADCGLLVDPLDPSGIAAAIQWLLEHPSEAAAMGDRGALAVRERFNWSSEAAKLTHYYREQLVG